MYAIVETGGKQVKVTEGEIVYIEKLPVADNDTVTFDHVLFFAGDNDTKIGAPYVDGAKVTAKVLKNGKSKKVMVYKYKAKKNYRNLNGHRQPYTKVQIEKIVG